MIDCTRKWSASNVIFHIGEKKVHKFVELMQVVHNTCTTKALNGKPVIIQLFPHLVPVADTGFAKKGGAALM